ncbi:MAG: bifunctional phosphoribosyl-AMP cyclohydrolase/phosphoribosyl-ATP diphosphatase HisIE [Firmicutes bacterium]|nr:bifunctional phosphoribosyl-AMP cyclohydrolase/phosphoribosyl-ATP diphosphatase HisIE [Bacillota bacterium]MTI70599.1 bifunctional phosphoribosyl-AMP cyclohydrolase/phosphoribosyl-ATP diphosphatase HisIE [Bacillota bacterium]
MDFINDIKFDSKGLIPAIIQDINTKKVLMLGYMNKESIKKTIETKRTWFFSRSRNKLWNKGETSKNYQEVKNMYYDCDGDTLLVEVDQKGVACHTGKYSCFYNNILKSYNEIKGVENILDKLYETVKERKVNPKKDSYTNYLFDEGLDKILKKVGEEASEVIIGAKNNSKEETIYEMSDLIYHLFVLMVEMDIDIDEIKKELFNRYTK